MENKRAYPEDRVTYVLSMFIVCTLYHIMVNAMQEGRNKCIGNRRTFN